MSLLLDGQQRMTSLCQSAFAKQPVRTRTPKGTEVDRFYYLDIKKAVSSNSHMDDAIIGMPGDQILRRDFGREVVLDLSTPSHESENDLFPLNRVFDSRDWFFDWRDYWRSRDRDVSDLERDFDRGVIDRIERYKMPIIRLDRTNSREAICLVFEKVNVGGKKLDAFELLTAIYAADSFDLRTDWNGPISSTAAGRRARIIGSPNRRDVLTRVASTDFLQACTLLQSRANRLARQAEGVEGKELPQVSCHRDALLALPLDAYRTHADAVERGFIEAGIFLNENKIIWHKDVPYPPQLVALAAVFAILGKSALNAAKRDKLARWFWCIALGERYGSATESKLAQDVPDLVGWLANDDSQPRSVKETLFQRDRLITLRHRVSAAYKAIHTLLMRKGCEDFISGRPTDIMTFFDDRIDIHHIFPQKWCKKQGIKPGLFNSIVNKTPLSKASNVIIGGDAPSVYLKRIQDRHGISAIKLDDILHTHLIIPEPLRADDFHGFFADRIGALCRLVADAMGKPVVEDRGADEDERDIDAEIDEEADDELAAA